MRGAARSTQAGWWGSNEQTTSQTIFASRNKGWEASLTRRVGSSQQNSHSVDPSLVVLSAALMAFTEAVGLPVTTIVSLMMQPSPVTSVLG